MMSLGTELQPVQLLNCMIIAETLPVPLQNILGSSAIVWLVTVIKLLKLFRDWVMKVLVSKPSWWVKTTICVHWAISCWSMSLHSLILTTRHRTPACLWSWQVIRMIYLKVVLLLPKFTTKWFSTWKMPSLIWHFSKERLPNQTSMLPRKLLKLCWPEFISIWRTGTVHGKWLTR